MSGDAVVAFLGLCLAVNYEEIEGLEERSDDRIQSARRVGLDHYWGNFGGLAEEYFLLIGKRIGVFGPEGKGDVSIGLEELNSLFDDTKRKLTSAGFDRDPSVHIKWHPDV
jgi:hypothetical protein